MNIESGRDMDMHEQLTTFPTFRNFFRAIVSPAPRYRKSVNKTKKAKAAKTEEKSHMIKFELDGPLSMGVEGKLAINGQEFVLDEQTWVFGNIANGAHASVQGVFGNGGERYATKIVIK